MTTSFSLPSFEDVLTIRSEPYNKRSTGLFLIQSGIVRVFRPSQTAPTLTVDFYGPGQIFGLACLSDSQPEEEVAVAHSDCAVFEWPTSLLHLLMAEKPATTAALLRLAVEQSARLLDRVSRAERLGNGENLRLNLLDLAERIGTKGRGVSVIQPGIPQHILAEMVGTTREIVTQNMLRLRRAGALEYSRSALVLYPARLSEQMAQGVAA